MKNIILALACALVLGGCGDSVEKNGKALDGVYTSKVEVSSLTFSKDGKVSTTLSDGTRVTTTYVIDGNKVRYKFPEGLPRELILEQGILKSKFSEYHKQ